MQQKRTYPDCFQFLRLCICASLSRQSRGVEEGIVKSLSPILWLRVCVEPLSSLATTLLEAICETTYYGRVFAYFIALRFAF